MTKPKLYNPFELSQFTIYETWYYQLKVYNEKLCEAVLNRDAMVVNDYLWILSDLHQFLKIQNIYHKIPLPCHNSKLMKLKGELCDVIFHLCLYLQSMCSNHSKNYHNQIDWFLKIVEEQRVFYKCCDTKNDTVIYSKKDLTFLRKYKNPVNQTNIHTWRFVEDCIQYAEQASNKANVGESWKKFISIKSKLIPQIQKEYLPIITKEDGLYSYVPKLRRHEKLDSLVLQNIVYQKTFKKDQIRLSASSM